MEQQGSINMTAAMEALSPFLKKPRRIIIQVEAFTSGIVLLLLLQLILGSFRRQSTNFLVQAGTWVTYTLSFPAIAFTLGLMQSSPVKNVMYPIWAVSLLMAAGCTNAVKVYELNDNKQWKRSLFNILQYIFYVMLICALISTYTTKQEGVYFRALSTIFATFKSPVSVLIALAAVALLTGVMGREFACVLVEVGYFMARGVAKFMKNLPADDGDGFDPATMKGYKYPVQINGPFGRVTIDQIWHCEGRLLSSGTVHCKELKDLCLAKAMCELLKRRYYGLSFAEEHLNETHDFVFKGLLQKQADYERAFRIVEMELGFCHDFFFTKHAIIFELEFAFFLLFIMRIVLIATCVSFVVQSTLSVQKISPIIEVHTERAEQIITLLVLATFLLIEILQATFYLASDWCKVSVTCRYVKRSWYHHNAFIQKLIGYISRFAIFGYWKNKIDQYSIIPRITAGDSSGDSSHPINMLQAVKRAIASSLISCDGPPTNGEASLEGKGVLLEFSWALQGQSQTETMLIWSIATDYCHMTPPTGDGEHVNGASENEQDTKVNRTVSVCLSRYCTYLMNSAPELLPGHFGDTKLAMSEVKREAYKALRSQNVSSRPGLTSQNVNSESGDYSFIFQNILIFDGNDVELPAFVSIAASQKIYLAMNRLQDQEEDRSIFMRGVKLGKQLEGIPSSALRWKIMADFWAEKILYIAPSDNVKGHMELLAKGGEFLTHIWVLLTHAGILKINREEDNNTTPRRQPPQGDV
ncbi:unnamed protein product [Triticum turgidum subsp. durum]|uniref:DUF4220 domain-containing protein n=1 Tax=Triticum turgidum subsp. durum TaxID=4567 RepID=A0A9R0XCA7_TRITD|nr:unnamed protein product [Triticum turgidum subsp. durum]